MDDKVYNPSNYPLVETAITNRLIIKDPGKELRDEFAGQALIGLISHCGVKDCDTLADLAYEFADAMMNKRKKR